MDTTIIILFSLTISLSTLAITLSMYYVVLLMNIELMRMEEEINLEVIKLRNIELDLEDIL